METSVCSRFHAAVELIGRRWNGAILQAILGERHRYADIRCAVPGLSDTMLARRLREMEAEGLVERLVVPSSPVHVEYYLTPKGLDLAPVLVSITTWAHTWIEVPSPAGASDAEHGSTHPYAQGARTQ